MQNRKVNIRLKKSVKITIYFMVVIGLGVLYPSSAMEPQQPSMILTLKQGVKKAMEEKRHQDAATLLIGAIQSNGALPCLEERNTLAGVYLEMKDNPKALEQTSWVLQNSPNPSVGHLRMALYANARMGVHGRVLSLVSAIKCNHLSALTLDDLRLSVGSAFQLSSCDSLIEILGMMSSLFSTQLTAVDYFRMSELYNYCNSDLASGMTDKALALIDENSVTIQQARWARHNYRLSLDKDKAIHWGERIIRQFPQDLNVYDRIELMQIYAAYREYKKSWGQVLELLKPPVAHYQSEVWIDFAEIALKRRESFMWDKNDEEANKMKEQAADFLRLAKFLSDKRGDYIPSFRYQVAWSTIEKY